MGIFLAEFAFLYLLAPLAGIVFGAAMLLIAKKNRLLHNKKALFYFLLSVLILASPALLGLIDYWFMPKAYISLSALYLLLGYFNIFILKTITEDPEEMPYVVEFFCTLLTGLTGAALFSLVFNLCNELQYGLWASSCMIPFIFPSLFLKTVDTCMNIPLEVYKAWSYKKENHPMLPEYRDSDKIIVVELELFRQIQDREKLNLKVKASENMPFGLWFKILINDYNKKSPSSPIVYEENNNFHEWVFYVNSSVSGRKKHIDPDFSFAENKIKGKNTIVAKRAEYTNRKRNTRRFNE
ncbi:MAG: TssN family type VI secretion system protein [Candidatus Symbiothrix sp.]|jgi:hypothetical protein|nr:TssN family type VI secretion system protein [Candidatus Symbiothrix sp.]